MDDDVVAADASPEELVKRLTRALRIIQVGMLREARARQWCGEYENFAKEINAAAGFQALGERMRRVDLQFTVSLRVRCGMNDQGLIIDEFMNHIAAYSSTLAVEVSVPRIEPRVMGTDDADDEERPAGWDPMASCNCEACRQDRLTRQRLADRPTPPVVRRVQRDTRFE